MSSASHGGDCSKKIKKDVACCITVLMYPICGATLNFRLNPFLSFVLDDMVPEFFLFADTMAAKRQLQTLALGWVSTWGARSTWAVSSVGQGLGQEGENAPGLMGPELSLGVVCGKGLLSPFSLANE